MGFFECIMSQTPSLIVRALKDLKDGGSGVRNVLLVDVIKGRPGGDGDVGEGRGGDDSRLRREERHSILN